MDVLTGPYYSLTRKYLSFVGLWPYADKKRVKIRTFVTILLIVLTVPHFISMVVHFKNVDRLMLNILTNLTLFVIIAKVIGLTVAEEQLRTLYDNLSDNWLAIRDESERKILHKYSAVGRKLTIMYTALILVCGVSIFALPSLPDVLDLIDPLPEPRPHLYLVEGEYFVDREEHYIKIFISNCFTVAVLGTNTVIFDTSFIVSVVHCCALFNITKFRLLKLQRMVSDKSNRAGRDDSYEWLVETIQVHQRALNFGATMNDAYSTCFFFVFIMHIVLIPLTVCAMLANSDSPLNILPYAVFMVTIVQHLFVLSCAGQSVYNHGFDLSDAVYCNEWYTVPVRTKKLLLIVMLRCSEPTSLTAGLLFINYQSYSMIMRTAVSYVTVLSSFR